MRLKKISRVPQEFIAIIYKVAGILDFKYIEYEIEFGNDDIDCFAGDIRKVKIRGMKYGVNLKACVLIKWHSNPTDRTSFREYYRREYVFHTLIAPELLKIQRTMKVEGLKLNFLNVVLACIDHDKETIVIQNIDKMNFLNRFERMDIAHAALVVKNIAKLHGLSFVLKKRYPHKFKEIIEFCSHDVVYSDIQNVSSTLVRYFKTSVDVVLDPVAKKRLLEFGPHVLLALHKCTFPDKDYSTICHSDCWTNNIMFKYQGIKPVDMIFIDFQLVRYASPVTDLSYFLYMSTDRELLAKNYDNLLNLYYGTLTAVITYCNLNIENVYPKRIFQKHLKEYSVLGLIEALISMKIITAVPEEAMEMTNMKYHFSEGLCEYVSKNQSLYVERVNGVVNDFFGRGYVLDAILTE